MTPKNKPKSKVRERHFKRWDALERALLELKTKYRQVLFRGQHDRRWRLNTTLDRRFGQPVPARQYFRLIAASHPQVETFKGASWLLPQHDDIEAWSTDYDHRMKFAYTIPAYEYLVYLRHHGFPSPLLDWSHSPYVAAYFAFAHAPPSGRVAIFAYSEYGAAGKVTGSNEPQIARLGPYVRGHSRHFLQQCEYTMAKFFDDGQWCFVPHDDVFGSADPEEDQDLLWKFTAPATERGKVLRSLDAHNLNAFSLFQSDEALLETIAFREIDLKAQSA